MNTLTDSIPHHPLREILYSAVVSVVVFSTLAFAPAYGLSATLILDPIPDLVYAGDTIVFTGTLTGGSSALPSRTILICEDDPLWPDECFAIGTTDGAGRFYIGWIVEDSSVETDFDIYAKFDGDFRYDSDQTLRQEMIVYELRGGRLTLDPIQNSTWFGEVVEMSGTLRLDGRSPEGAIIYIKDEDTLNPDDLLTSAYVDASGRFTTYWIAQDVDPTNTIEIQAVFEKDSTHRRLATDIQKIAMSDLPRPEFTPAGSEGYMELFYSHSFDHAPRVLIVPNPDSYDSVKKHIAPVQEGISLLTAMLEREYSYGDWNMEFEVVTPGDRASFEPDIIVNLDSRQDDDGCGEDYTGWAIPSVKKPVQTVVCSLDLADINIRSTTMHEIIHAMGVGHTFNIRGDMLCSKEKGYGYTCPPGPHHDKSRVPSELNLAAVAEVYGTDGFQNPNNNITYGEKFTLNDNHGSEPTILELEQNVVEEYHIGSISTDVHQYKEGEVILVDGIYMGEYEEYLSLYLTDQYGDVVGVMPVPSGAMIEGFFPGVYLAGTYTVWLYDEHDWAEGNSFKISGVDDAAIYADEIWYSPGDTIYLEGFYRESYDGWSELVVVDPFWNVIEHVDIRVVGDFFGEYVGGYDINGRYLVLLHDDSGNLAASTAFYVLFEP
ncbi:MAG: hypothetical protein F4Y82_00630 [Cenarchaeum sp. SB0665_bin_23]|nr:hypothetical protein [Cenarchaeum sp. SB0665_bin_23]MYB47491.1 hypothetical protein [Cenarchaeum sp. SB0662_bin_33]MYG32986.1 hypothetical protein [Cenarchaeum sp. SB0677_bin_16]